MKTNIHLYYCTNSLFASLLLTGFSVLLLRCQPSGQQKVKENSVDAETASANVNESRDEEESAQKVILFFGNSLTAGYGLEAEESFPSLIQDKLDSLTLDYKVVNAGLSGETTASGNSRLDWVLERQPVDIFVLELGANDGLRGIPTEETNRNLRSMINKVKEANPNAKIILSGMMVPPNMGPEYAEQFQQLYPIIAEEEDVMLIPFLLEDVAGEPELNQSDGIHPTAKGQEIVAENVWEELQQAIEETPNS